MNLPKRKSTRLKSYDYNAPGAYFITICTKDRKQILSHICVGLGVLDEPKNKLTYYGKIADKYLTQMSNFYDNITLDKYVIMPNHIHLLIQIKSKPTSGSSRTPSPTNNEISRFISTFKRFCNKEYGRNIWQSLSHDHVVRNQKDYDRIWTYIEINPYKWEQDVYIKKRIYQRNSKMLLIYPFLFLIRNQSYQQIVSYKIFSDYVFEETFFTFGNYPADVVKAEMVCNNSCSVDVIIR